MASPVRLLNSLSKSETLGGRHWPWCLHLCPVAHAHRPDKCSVSGFPTGDRASGGSRCLNSILPAFYSLFPSDLNEEKTRQSHNATVAWLPACWLCGEKKIMGKIKIHGTQLKGRGQGGETSRSPVCSEGQLLGDLCLCSPGPGALIPD